MARVTHVKKAQQRYKTVPVIDPDTGQPKRTPVMDKRTGQQKVSKRGPVWMAVTQADKSQPLPDLECDYSGCTINDGKIAVGTPYQHITPKSGPYGGRQMNRHAEHPTWNVWEYSSSLSARLAQISNDFWQEVSSAEGPDDVISALESAAGSVREIAEEKREGASNIEEGFGHSTSASEELEEIAGSLGSWADEIEQADVPDLPEPDERWFIRDTRTDERVGETEEGYDSEQSAQDDLASILEDKANNDEDDDEDNYQIFEETPEDPTEDQMNEWHEDVEGNLTIIDESPV